MKEAITGFSIKHYKSIIISTFLLALILGLQIPKIKIDTDPENMLSEKEFVRVFHNKAKKDFSLYDFVILGIVNEDDPNGVFNKDTLSKIYNITEEIKQIELESPGHGTIRPVITRDIISPSTVDNIREGSSAGEIRFEWLMREAPSSEEEALSIRDEAIDNPLLYGTMVSEDKKALCIYIPIKNKNLSHMTSLRIFEIAGKYPGAEKYYITGLPVAEDTFGFEMFKQMAISAPLAGLIIFLLMWSFFRKAKLIIAPMLVAIITVISTMGLLIGLGFTVHIMSSMIPIFLMPIAVVDSVHILSEFFDRYNIYKDKKKTITHVMNHLFMPMLYTSLTTTAGFASLALTPIPPVQIFGIFVAAGVMFAWVLTVLFIPAYTMLIKDTSLENFGFNHGQEKKTVLTGILHKTGEFTWKRSRLIIFVSSVLIIISAYGLSLIEINDNPVKWFTKSHRIRIADDVLNSHFGGTYTAYLILDRKDTEESFIKNIRRLREKTEAKKTDVSPENIVALLSYIDQEKTGFIKKKNYNYTEFTDTIIEKSEELSSDDESWDEVIETIEDENINSQIFKNPAMLEYMGKLQDYMASSKIVGKSTSAADLVKKVYMELMGGNRKYYTIPPTTKGVAQSLFQFQNGHKPDDLWHLLIPDYKTANIWIQMKSGDNKDMEKVLKMVAGFMESNPPPFPLDRQWAGLTYLNVEWQNKMVHGMISSLIGSFIIVLLMMIFLFRSPLWGILSMVPLSITILLIYGLIGLTGKDYDMPVAVLSSLTLGLSVDFAIHFLERTRTIYAETQSVEKTMEAMFGEPARAISRNAIVIAIGFLPLLAAPLVPYKTVGFFLASIMAVSSLTTIVLLPALIKTFAKSLFRPAGAKRYACNCIKCIITMSAGMLIITCFILNNPVSRWKLLTVVSAAAILAAGIICNTLSK
ncbi:MAG: MMPL family transporter, partial [Candidatus Aureabacteria bacterium]|nr:MMPL family transporter [Candidatus Auribacterota bacterium]